MGEGYVATIDDWQKVIDECEKQFQLMENTVKEMGFARIVQENLHHFAQEQLHILCNTEKKGKV